VLQGTPLYKHCRDSGLHVIQAYGAIVPLQIRLPEPCACYDVGQFRSKTLPMAKAPYVAIAPHSPMCFSHTWPGAPPNKEWPRDRWLRLIDRVPEDYRVYEFGAANESPLGHPRVEPIYGADIRIVAELLRHAHVVVALDNGLAHLARAVQQRRLVMLHGTHAPLSFATYPGVTVVHNGQPIGELPVELAWEGVEGALAATGGVTVSCIVQGAAAAS
jgi:ADP-heptose:LPS heptosyltransferase